MVRKEINDKLYGDVNKKVTDKVTDCVRNIKIGKHEVFPFAPLNKTALKQSLTNKTNTVHVSKSQTRAYNALYDRLITYAST